MKYYEDLEIGTARQFGPYEVKREEVLEFAGKYDPQPFHLDDEAAAQTYFGRLSASGWHTCAMTMAMMVKDNGGQKIAWMGSPGIDKLRWLHPVYPGDTLSASSELVAKRRSKSKPEMGIFTQAIVTRNQNGVAVLDMQSNAMIKVRDPSGTD